MSAWTNNSVTVHSMYNTDRTLLWLMGVKVVRNKTLKAKFSSELQSQDKGEDEHLYWRYRTKSLTKHGRYGSPQGTQWLLQTPALWDVYFTMYWMATSTSKTKQIYRRSTTALNLSWSDNKQNGQRVCTAGHWSLVCTAGHCMLTLCKGRSSSFLGMLSFRKPLSYLALIWSRLAVSGIRTVRLTYWLLCSILWYLQCEKKITMRPAVFVLQWSMAYCQLEQKALCAKAAWAMNKNLQHYWQSQLDQQCLHTWLQAAMYQLRAHMPLRVQAEWLQAAITAGRTWALSQFNINEVRCSCCRRQYVCWD